MVVITGDDGNNILRGGDGSDTIDGGAGDDILFGHGAGGESPTAGQINAIRVATGLSSPVFASAAPGDPGRLFIGELRTGIIKILDLASGVTAVTPFLDLPDSRIGQVGERGFLGFAFHPDFANNRQVFVSIVNPAGNTEILRFTTFADDPNRIDPASETLIWTFPRNAPLSNHNGGWIGFGPDGYLYIASGDGGGSGDPDNLAQDRNSLMGKMLRIDVSGADAFPGDPNRNYAIPVDNPFAAGGGAAEIWALGLRNPWRASFDSATGDLYIADVGQGRFEEVNWQPAGAPGGWNYGWAVLEGNAVYDGTRPGNPSPTDPSLIDPVHVYAHGTQNGASVTGGYVYHGPRAGLDGYYVFGDFVSGRIATFRIQDGAAVNFTNLGDRIAPNVGTIGSIVSFALDAAENLYVITFSGHVYRLDPSAGSADGDDLIRGGDGADTIYGAAGADTLLGENGSDLLVGGLGNDQLSGGGGDDSLAGNSGGDTLTGGTGIDLFRDTVAGFNGDTIVDLAAGERIIFTDANLGNFTFSINGSTLTYTGGTMTLSVVPGGTPIARAADGGGVELVILANDVRNDFNGDGRSDILWRNVDGQLSNWLGVANGGFTPNDANAAAMVPTDWQVVGTGDFNGDGRDDILWRNDNGTVSNWLGTAAGGFTPNDANATRFVPTDWHVVGTGDFNGDGRDDILWRNNDGTVSDWLGQANGGFILNDAAALTVVPTAWFVAGTGDFNGDGRDDILWRNDDGQLSNWLGQADGGFTPNNANAAASVSTAWQIVGTGDFNGDGRDDILWRNNDGTLSNWLGQANGGFVANDANAAAFVPTAWTVVATGDYNGDGRDDILWRHTDGTLSNWLGTASGGFTPNDANAAAAVPTSWHVQPEPFIL